MSNQVVHITTQELATEYRVDASTVRRWVESGKIVPALTTPGGHYRFVLEDVKASLQAKGRVGATAELAEAGEQ